MTFLEIAERCEQATGPDRESDVAIHTAVTTFEPRVGGVGWPAGELVVPAFPGWEPLPAYTASLDAAITLVPEGFDVHFYLERRGGSSAIVTSTKALGLARVFAATPALAICTAALRARASIGTA